MEMIFANEDFRVRIIPDDTGRPWWVASDVCQSLKIQNPRRAVAGMCSQKGVRHAYTNPKDKRSLNTLIDEGNLYRLVLKSRSAKAVKFQDWLVEEVIPSIRKTGVYSVSKKVRLTDQLSIPHQKQNSKDVNAVKFRVGGVEAVIANNRDTQKAVTGKEPHEWREEGARAGLKSKQRSSGKEVLRNLRPELACGVSFADELVALGHDMSTATDIAKGAIETFDRLIQIGVKPAELDS